MNKPVTADTPTPAPLDAERERLRKSGYTDSEINQILIARELAGSPQAAGTASSGVMSNVLSSLVAVASHARSVVPSFRKDVATIFDRAASAPTRAGATASLADKAIVVLVLGYAAWQEWQQHIISATAIAEQQARKIRVETDAIANKPTPLCELYHNCPPSTNAAQLPDAFDPAHDNFTVWCFRSPEHLKECDCSAVRSGGDCVRKLPNRELSDLDKFLCRDSVPESECAAFLAKERRAK
jgi:hypothetical protein